MLFIHIHYLFIYAIFRISINLFFVYWKTVPEHGAHLEAGETFPEPGARLDAEETGK